MEHEPVILTIGYGNRSTADVFKLLNAHSCSFLIDVRSSPYSRTFPEYNRECLKNDCGQAGIKYVFMGDLLGGRPAAKDCYTADGHVNYGKLAEKPFFLKGIQRLQDALSQGYRTALLCSEKKPEKCHRSKLIGSVLAQKGIPVLHIDEQNQLISQTSVIKRITNGQMELFGEDEKLLRSNGQYPG